MNKSLVYGKDLHKLLMACQSVFYDYIIFTNTVGGSIHEAVINTTGFNSLCFRNNYDRMREAGGGNKTAEKNRYRKNNGEKRGYFRNNKSPRAAFFCRFSRETKALSFKHKYN